jgi:hypothetical protein
VATVLAGPDVRRGFRLSDDHTHYSTLRTIEQALGLPPRGSSLTGSLDGAFTEPPRLAVR